MIYRNRRWNRFLVLSFAMIFSLGITTGMTQTKRKKCACGSMVGYYTRLKTDHEFAKNEKSLEEDINHFIQRYKRSEVDEIRSGIVVIPVVVHVIYNTKQENISDKQIRSQIDALNRDFRRMNEDLKTVPPEFLPFATDTRIEFKLAKRDPMSKPTNGITRTQTKVQEFTHDFNADTETERNPMKFDVSGGKDAWPSDRYLNIWVCDLGDMLLGYASFPSDLHVRPKEDGVVVDYEYFGTSGTAKAPYNLGRTTTHEIGHWLNLRHIWGDERPGEDVCSRSDFVDDTPNQASPNFDCPNHPQASCGSNDMFMNYMDYVYDECMTMFTHGQSDRMNAVLFTSRSSIVSSQGDIPPPRIAKADLFLRDSEYDLGDEPNTISEQVFNSNDIWVRNSNDGFKNQEHQNPNPGTVNHVYVRVRNRGNIESKEAKLKLYWAKSSTGFSWPGSWEGNSINPIPTGGVIGERTIDPIPHSDFQIIEFKWKVPSRADLSELTAKNLNFSLLARIETINRAPFGMSNPESPNLHQNVRRNNNIALKNVSVTEHFGERLLASFLLSNNDKRKRYYKLSFVYPEDEMSIFDYGDIRVLLDKKLFKDWRYEGELGNGVQVKRKKDGIRILYNGAYIKGLKLKKNKSSLVTLWFKPHNSAMKFKRNLFRLDVKQIDVQRKSENYIGENTILFKVKK